MALSYASAAKLANGGKHSGTKINQDLGNLRARFEKTQATVMIAPLAEAERRKLYPLLALPYPLRLKILNYAIKPVTTAFFLPGGKGKKGSSLPLDPLACHTDERFRLESLIVTIEKSTIEIHSGPANEGVQQRLESVDFTPISGDTSYKTGFDAVKSLRFPDFSRFPHHRLPADAKNQDIALKLRCKNLTTLPITWVDEEVTYFAPMPGYQPKDIDVIRRQSHLDDMLKIKGLKHLHLAARTTNQVYEEPGHVGFNAVIALQKWVEGAYVNRGIEVSVTVNFVL